MSINADAIAAIEKNAPQVLAEALPFLPSALAKIPRQVRAVLIALVAIGATYLIGAWLFGWPASDLAKHIFDLVAGPTGLVALGNVPAGSKLTIGQAAAAEGDVLAQAQAALAGIQLPGVADSPVVPEIPAAQPIVAAPAAPTAPAATAVTPVQTEVAPDAGGASD